MTKKLTIIFLLIFLMIIATWGMKFLFDPFSVQIDARFQPPSVQYLFGTDELGRDVFSRVFYGARNLLGIALGVVILPILIGTPLGIFSVFSKKTKGLINFLNESVIVIPDILVVLFLVSLMGGGLLPLLITLSIVYTPYYIRIIQGNMLRFKTAGHILALRARGVKNINIIFKHLVPLTVRQISVQASYNAGNAIFITTTLGFLGLGLGSSIIEWGGMIRDSLSYLLVHPWPLIFYSGFALATSYFFNLLGEYLKSFFAQHEYAS